MEFKKGDRIVCVREAGWRAGTQTFAFTIGKVYTVLSNQGLHQEVHVEDDYGVGCYPTSNRFNRFDPIDSMIEAIREDDQMPLH